MKSGYSYLFIGAPGAGKSTLMKALTKNVSRDRLHVYDINDEYKLGDYNDLPEMDEFLDEMLNVRKSVIIFEDATSFFRGRSSKKMIRLISLKRHRKNIILMAFHSIRSVPFDIVDLMQPGGMFLLKTSDVRDIVDKRIPGLLEAYDKVQSAPPTKYPYINYKFVPL